MKLTILFLLIFLSTHADASVDSLPIQKAYDFLSSITETSDLSGEFYCDNTTSVEMRTFSSGEITTFFLKSGMGQSSRSFLSFTQYTGQEHMRLGKSLSNGDVESLSVSEDELEIVVKSYNPWASSDRYRITITLQKEGNSLSLYRAIWEVKQSRLERYKYFFTQECR